MFKKIKIQIIGIKSINDKIRIETEIDVLEGIKNIEVSEKTGNAEIEFDNELISQEIILEKIKELGYEMKETPILIPFPQEYIYYVSGMHCASCEILIEKKLLEIKNIKSVEASVNQGTARIVYEGERPKVQRLNSIFEKEGYLFFEGPIKKRQEIIS
jgi:copper chaperone CopZ